MEAALNYGEIAPLPFVLVPFVRDPVRRCCGFWAVRTQWTRQVAVMTANGDDGMEP